MRLNLKHFLQSPSGIGDFLMRLIVHEMVIMLDKISRAIISQTNI